MKAYIKLYCKKNRIRLDGTAPIYFSIRMGTQKLLYTGKNIKPELFDNKLGEITNKRNYGKLNLYLENEKNKINDIILDLQYRNEVMTHDKIIARYKNHINQSSFLTFAYAELEDQKSYLKTRSYQDYSTSLNSLKEYRPTVTFEEISVQFLRDFEGWLKIKKQRKQNSRYRNFVAIRKFLRIAISKGLTKSYPFEEFKFSLERVERDYITEEELKDLHELYDSNKLSKKLQNTLCNFLFTCYTGISGDDLKAKGRLKFHDDHIRFERGKTSKFVKIPLTRNAKKLYPDLSERPLKQSVSRISDDLEEIMSKAKINKKITYHAGRHTFAIISLMKGISLPVISKVLGHTSIKTTEIYARVVDELLNKEMLKWDANPDSESTKKKKGRSPKKARRASLKPLAQATKEKV